jgi:hypothetical protein
MWTFVGSGRGLDFTGKVPYNIGDLLSSAGAFHEVDMAPC